MLDVVNSVSCLRYVYEDPRQEFHSIIPLTNNECPDAGSSSRSDYQSEFLSKHSAKYKRSILLTAAISSLLRFRLLPIMSFSPHELETFPCHCDVEESDGIRVFQPLKKLRCGGCSVKISQGAEYLCENCGEVGRHERFQLNRERRPLR